MAVKKKPIFSRFFSWLGFAGDIDFLRQIIFAVITFILGGTVSISAYLEGIPLWLLIPLLLWTFGGVFFAIDYILRLYKREILPSKEKKLKSLYTSIHELECEFSVMHDKSNREIYNPYGDLVNSDHTFPFKVISLYERLNEIGIKTPSLEKNEVASYNENHHWFITSLKHYSLKGQLLLAREEAKSCIEKMEQEQKLIGDENESKSS